VLLWVIYPWLRGTDVSVELLTSVQRFYICGTPHCQLAFLYIICRYLNAASKMQSSGLISSHSETMTRAGTMNRSGSMTTQRFGAKRKHLSTTYFSSVRSSHIAELRTSCSLVIKSHNCRLQPTKSKTRVLPLNILPLPAEQTFPQSESFPTGH
jgi:hypothetical protein